jgi:hypothetical protein
VAKKCACLTDFNLKRNFVNVKAISTRQITIPKLSLFLHIQKTAGTSVVNTVQEYYGDNLISHRNYSPHKPDEFRHTGFVSGHFGYGYAQHLMKSRYCFTFLRDPAERVLSFYYFCLRSNPEDFAVYKLAQEQNIDDFLDLGLDHPQVKPFIWNHQTWQLACGWGNTAKKSIYSCDEKDMINLAISHLSEFDHVGFCETFDEDMAIILNEIGIKCVTQIAKLNVSHNRPRKEDLPSSTTDRLRRVTELDQILYNHARAIRRTACMRKEK